jgi:TorA specific chaperone
VTSLATASRRTRDLSAALDWLSVLFGAPLSVEAVSAHRRGPAAALIAALARDADFAPGIARMRIALDRGDDDEAGAARLNRAYRLAFEGLGGPRTVPLCESAHRGGSRRLFQAPTAELEALLAENDLSMPADVRLPADHIAIELALTALLVETGSPGAKAMICRLAEWIPAFAAECAEVDEDGFWAGAAGVLNALMAREARAILANGQDELETTKEVFNVTNEQ